MEHCDHEEHKHHASDPDVPPPTEDGDPDVPPPTFAETNGDPDVPPPTKPPKHSGD